MHPLYKTNFNALYRAGQKLRYFRLALRPRENCRRAFRRHLYKSAESVIRNNIFTKQNRLSTINREPVLRGLDLPLRESGPSGILPHVNVRRYAILPLMAAGARTSVKWSEAPC